MIEKMTKYTILLLSSEKEDFLSQMQELGMLDIRRSSKPVDSYSEAILQDIRRSQQAVLALEKIDFSRDEDYAAVESRAAAFETEHTDADLLEEVAAGRAALASVAERRKALERECEMLKPWRMTSTASKQMASTCISSMSRRSVFPPNGLRNGRSKLSARLTIRYGSWLPGTMRSLAPNSPALLMTMQELKSA